MSNSRDHAWNTVVNTLRDQYAAVGGPPTRYGMAWAIVNALTDAGFDLTGADHREVEAAHRARVAALVELFRTEPLDAESHR